MLLSTTNSSITEGKEVCSFPPILCSHHLSGLFWWTETSQKLFLARGESASGWHLCIPTEALCLKFMTAPFIFILAESFAVIPFTSHPILPLWEAQPMELSHLAFYTEQYKGGLAEWDWSRGAQWASWLSKDLNLGVAGWSLTPSSLHCAGPLLGFMLKSTSQIKKRQLTTVLSLELFLDRQTDIEKYLFRPCFFL